MPTNNKFVLANRFAIAFQKAMGEPVNMTALLQDAAFYQSCVQRGLASDDAQLVDLSKKVSQAEGFVSQQASTLAAPAPSGQPGQWMHDQQWEKIKKLAIEISGPVGGILVQKIRAKQAPGSLSQAIEAVATGLGEEQGEKFRLLAKKSL